MYSTSMSIAKSTILVILSIVLSTGVLSAAEDLFLLDSLGNSGTHLYRVVLDDGAEMASIIPIQENLPLGGSYALACDNSGERCYIIERDTGYFGYYDLGLDGWYPLGFVDTDEQFTGIAGATCLGDDVILVASQDTDLLYVINPYTSAVTVVGPVLTNDQRGIDLSGADLAVDAYGRIFLWTNSTATLYQIILPASYPGTVQGYMVFEPDFRPFATGMAFRGNGLGPAVGSARAPSTILIQDGLNVKIYDMDGFDHRYGDMSNGVIHSCNYTIGYYKNHDWEGATVHICGVAIDEEIGAEVLWDAKNKNFSMLFAQMIGAKLNTFDATGIPFIDEAEAWLCSQENAFDGNELFFEADFIDRDQKGIASDYKTTLDDFNNSDHCD